MLRTILSIWMAFAFATSAFAHEYYFAYAELNYNELQKRIEGTLIFSTHDLERAIDPKGTLIGKFEKLDESSDELPLIEAYINAHLQITFGCALDSNAADVVCISKFSLEGVVTRPDGSIECYISTFANAIYNPVQIKFNALMERFTAQQNKLTFCYRNQKQTLLFIAAAPQKYFTIAP